MDRLTIRNGDGSVSQPADLRWAEALDKLAAYEDTGLSPEECAKYAKADKEGRYIVLKDRKRQGVDRLRKIAEADAEGRLVVLPCKPEDTVYGIRKSPKYGKYVKELTASAVGVIAWKHRTDTILITTKEDYYGKTVFLTREEAEKALEAEK